MADHYSKPQAYENFVGRWNARLALLYLDFTGVKDGERLLDVGCGTGVLSRALLDAAPGSELVGVDPSEPFLEYAREQSPGPRTTFDVGSALNLPYPDASFGQSLSLVVFMFIPDGVKAASEMRRVTRPGGAVSACVLDGGGGMETTGSIWEEAPKLDPTAKEKLEDRLLHNRRGQLTGLWNAAGLENVEETSLEFRVEFTSFNDYWLPFLHGVGPIGAYIEGLSPEGREALREALRRRFFGEKPDGPFTLGLRAWAVRGTVPD